jgi:hypothetical protein
MSKSRATSGKQGGSAPRWPEEEILAMIDLYCAGTSNHDIALELGRTIPQVKAMMGKVRKKRNLPFRDAEQIKNTRKRTIELGGAAALTPTELDADWQGPVPFGHWMITKPWKSSAVPKDHPPVTTLDKTQ